MELPSSIRLLLWIYGRCTTLPIAMKKTLTLFILTVGIVFSNQTYSQSINGIIEYKATFKLIEMELRLETEPFLEERTKELYQKSIRNNKDVLFSLVFNNNESYFSCKSELDNKYPPNWTSLKSGAKNIYYSSLKNKESFRINSSFNKLLIIQEPKKWKFTNETKVIDNYVCYKAKTIRILRGRKGVKEQTIIAWFTKDIPVPFGIQNLNGLQGLILELYIGNSLSFKATNIDLDPKEKIEIIKPKGKRISSEEFAEMIRGAVNAR